MKNNPWKFKHYYIPKRMRDGMIRYVKDGIRPGNFLCEIIANNLKEACYFADDENMANLPAYVNYFYNHAPISCWGSHNARENWIKEHKERKERNDGNTRRNDSG